MRHVRESEVLQISLRNRLNPLLVEIWDGIHIPLVNLEHEKNGPHTADDASNIVLRKEEEGQVASQDNVPDIPGHWNFGRFVSKGSDNEGLVIGSESQLWGSGRFKAALGENERLLSVVSVVGYRCSLYWGAEGTRNPGIVEVILLKIRDPDSGRHFFARIVEACITNGDVDVFSVIVFRKIGYLKTYTSGFGGGLLQEAIGRIGTWGYAAWDAFKQSDKVEYQLQRQRNDPEVYQYGETSVFDDFKW